MELSSFDYHYLAKEWQVLVGGKVQKVYLKDRTHLIHIYNKGQFHLVFTDGCAFFTKNKLAWPKEPSGYALFLRRRLSNARVRHVAQLNGDRIVAIDFENLEGPVRFIAELLGECNSMFVREGKIVSVLATHNYADRTVRGGAEYVPPPARPAADDVPDANLLGKPAARTFAMEFGLGSKYAEELCARADIRKSDALTEAHIVAARTALDAMRNASIAAVHTEEEALPFPFLTKPGSEQWTKAESFNAALDAVMTKKLALAEHAVATADVSVLATKQEKILVAQRSQRIKLEKSAAEKQREGELMYEHYTELKELLENLKKDWKKMGLGEVREKYSAHPLVRKINDDGTFEIELGEPR